MSGHSNLREDYNAASTTSVGVGSAMHISRAGIVHHAQNIIQSYTYNEGDRPDSDTEVDDQDEGLKEEWGYETLSETHACRWTQTNSFIYLGHKQTVHISDNYARVDVKINKDAARWLNKRKISAENITDSVLKCLARLDWNGAEIHHGAMTAWKLTMTEGMNTLLEEVLTEISTEPNLHKLCQLVKKAFQKKMQLESLHSGSLVFLFHHLTTEDAEYMLSSVEDQKIVQKILLDFLPGWVKEKEIFWEVIPCSSSTGDEDVECQFDKPISLFCQKSGSVPSMDCRHIERTIERTMDRYMHSFRLKLAKDQRDVLHNFLQHLKQFADGNMKPELLQEESVPVLSPVPATEDCDRSLVSSEVKLPSHTPRVPSDSDFQPKSHEREASDTGNVDCKKLGLTRHSSETNKLLPSNRKCEEKFPAQQTALAAVALMPAAQANLPLEELLDGKGKSHLPLDSATTCTDPAEWRLDFERTDPKRWHEEDTKEFNEFGGKGHNFVQKGTGSQHHDEVESALQTQKMRPSKMVQAEQLLSWVSVKSNASRSQEPEIKRMLEQVENALQDEENESPKARALDTVLVLDTSDSVVNNHLDELKLVTHTFIDGIEENVDTMNLEENLAVVQMGGRAWVRQHLTNDYNRVRGAVEAMTPDSEEMPTGGKTPLFQALLVCLGAIEGRGGVVNVVGCHRVRPRLIFFTDGRPTDESVDTGPDMQSNLTEVKFSLVQLISEFASKKHKTTPSPIFWVPVGDNPDRPFMESLAALSGGKVVEKENVDQLHKYNKIQETIGRVYKMVRKHKDIYNTEEQIGSIVNALAGNLDEAEKDLVMEEVRKKQKDPENETANADDFDSIFEDMELVNSGALLALGTRVRRGPHWRWDNQDSEGPGTVIQHRKQRDGWLHVMWDNGTHNAYRYGEGEYFDVKRMDDDPRFLYGSELIEIGVQVMRGEDWKSGDEDGKGQGIVIRKRNDGKVKVRWENGYIGKYRYGTDNKMELKIIADYIPIQPGQQEEQLTSLTAVTNEQGVAGWFDPGEGPPRNVWQWCDPLTREWRTYTAETQDKLQLAYNQRKDGSCVIERQGRHRRVQFRTNQEKDVNKGETVPVQRLMMSEKQYLRMLQAEEEK